MHLGRLYYCMLPEAHKIMPKSVGPNKGSRRKQALRPPNC